MAVAPAYAAMQMAGDAGSALNRPGNVLADGTIISYEAAPESHLTMVKYMAIGVIIIAVMLVFWLMSQGPVKPYEYKSILGFTQPPVTMRSNQRVFGVVPTLAGVGLSN
jgi:hypothetical protein